MSDVNCQIVCKARKDKNWLFLGYTIIELLVGITIIGFLFSAGYAAFREFSRRQSLDAVARSMRGDLRFAQEQAMSGNKPPNDATYKCGCPKTDPSCGSTNYLSGYNFKVTGGTTYEIQAVCSFGTPKEIVTKTVTLTSGVTIGTPSPNPILFKVRGDGTNISTTPATITLTQTGTALVQTITVTNGGEIK
jgi:prepilin-type N-terminal cleavage/methylation domain-containing protein